MKYKVSDKRAEFLKKNFYEYSFKDIEPDFSIIDSIKEPIELHYIANNHNWDDGTELLIRIINNPNCDISTAKMIFWRSDVEGFISDSMKSDNSELINQILKNFEKDFFITQFFYYNPLEDPQSMFCDISHCEIINKQTKLFSNSCGKKLESNFTEKFNLRNTKYCDNQIKIDCTEYAITIQTNSNNLVYNYPDKFNLINQNIVDSFIDEFYFPDYLKDVFSITEKQIRKVLIRPKLTLVNDNTYILMFVFNAKPLYLIDSITNVSTIIRNERYYLQGFINIKGIEPEFDKVKKVKRYETWLGISKILVFEYSENTYYLKMVYLERDNLLYSFYIVSDEYEKLNVEHITENIKLN